MIKEFKRCPRCNFKTHVDMGRCGKCGLNYIKFADATNTEAKSAFRMGEKERILHTRNRPADVSKSNILVQAIFGGWFGLHYFNLGKIGRGIFQAIGLICACIYSYFAVSRGIRSGYAGFFILLCGFVWVANFITWISDIFAIIFNRFKYPVSLPYSDSGKGE